MIQAGPILRGIHLAAVFLALLTPLAGYARQTPTLILVDKKTNTLELAEYATPEFKVLQKFHTTVGKVIGDKTDEGDLKTPEGIYLFDVFLQAPNLQKRFGKMAFHMNFPNPYDKIASHTGKDIMLHATDTPDRLKQDFDSEGCVVLKDEEISSIAPKIRLGLTPILIFSELTPEWRKPEADPRLVQFFQSWIRAWEAREIEAYMSHYHTALNVQGRNKQQWRDYKSGLNQRYATISVGPESIVFYRHPKYSLIQFIQNYRSSLKGGGRGHVSRGTKNLVVVEERGELKIMDEDFTQKMW